MKKEINITESELKVMAVVWEQAAVSSKEITQRLEETEGWNPNTIRTLLARLEQKQVITHTKAGRMYIYTALIPRDYFVKQESKRFVQKFFDGKVSELVMSFVKEETLDQAEIAALRSLLEERKEDDESVY